jgi:hypothetical protein
LCLEADLARWTQVYSVTLENGHSDNVIIADCEGYLNIGNGMFDRLDRDDDSDPPLLIGRTARRRHRLADG